MINFSFIKEKLKLNKKRPLLRHLSLLLATMMLLSVAVWAWFALQQNADADGLNITMGASKNLDMSLDGGSTFHSSIDLLGDDDQQYIGESNKIKDKLYMYDITSDGDTFWSPKFLEQTSGIRTPDTTTDWSYAVANSAYISETIKFRTTFPADIYMGKNTAITTSATTLVGATAGNISDSGDFSRDCVVGALRISAVNSDNKLCFVMIPRSDVELVQASDGTFTVSTGDAVSDDAKKHTYYPDNYQSVGTTVTKNDTLLGFTAVENGAAPNDSTKIATTVLNPEDGYYYGTATVNIWLEGCDAETRRVLSGGKYNITLDFVAFEIDA